MPAKRKRKTPQAVPRSVLAQIPKGQKRALQSAIRALGGWDTDVACGRRRRRPRRTWKNTRKLIQQIEDAAGLDLDAFDPDCLLDAFCVPLEIEPGGSRVKGQRHCPVGVDSYGRARRGGWKKALKLALGQSGRRFEDLRNRDEWQIFEEALRGCEGLTLVPEQLGELESYLSAVEQCEQLHPDEIDQLIKLAKRKKLSPTDVPF